MVEDKKVKYSKALDLLSGDAKKKKVTLYLNYTKFQELQNLAKSKGVSASDVIDAAIDEILMTYKIIND